jgi:hypothetical protein
MQKRSLLGGSRFSSSTGDPVTPTAATARNIPENIVIGERRMTDEGMKSREHVRLLRDSSIQFSTRLYPSGLFDDGCVRPRKERLRGSTKTRMMVRGPA